MKRFLTIIVLLTSVLYTVKAQTSFVPNNNVIYELNLYNFTSEGTLAAAQQKIPFLKDVGVDIIWLMPVQTRGTVSKIGNLGSPYSLRNYIEVNPDHGTLADLQAFVKAAHEQGMQVWLDWVPNHTSKDNVWTIEHKEYYQLSGGNFVSPSGYGDVYQLNYSNVELQTAMIDAMQYWIINADIDGFRCDYASSSAIPTAFWTKCINQMHNQASGKQITMLAEADFKDKADMFNSGWDYDFAWQFQSQLTQFTTAVTLMANCKTLLDNTKYNSRTSRMVYLTNHDQNYSAGTMKTQYKNNQYCLTALLFTLYGMPMLYDGQETGYLYEHKLDYFNKTVIDWTSVDNKMLASVKALAQLKHSTKALQDNPQERGLTFLTTSIPAGTMAYVRKSGDEEVMVMLNVLNSSKTITISDIEAGKWQKVMDSSTISTEGMTSVDTDITSTTDFTIESNGFLVFTKGISTSIHEVSASTKEGNGAIYDLAGRRVTNPQHGIYIIDGHKILIK